VSFQTFPEFQYFDAKLPIVVFITSNYIGNTEIMEGCKENNIPCFGTLWDFVRILLSHSLNPSNGCCSEKNHCFLQIYNNIHIYIFMVGVGSERWLTLGVDFLTLHYV
jgi:hypothetical protein